jgi:hypothetical protein
MMVIVCQGCGRWCWVDDDGVEPVACSTRCRASTVRFLSWGLRHDIKGRWSIGWRFLQLLAWFWRPWRA